MHYSFNDLKELEDIIIRLDSGELNGFIENNIDKIVKLTKPKARILQYNEIHDGKTGFYCSNCKYQSHIYEIHLVELENCPSCLEAFACCDDLGELCSECYHRARLVVKEISEGYLSFHDI